MIVFEPETVKHTVTVFTDVDCAYCARLHRQMADYNELGIEIRYTAFPRAGIGSPTYDKMVSVWCAADQHTAMTDAKAGRPRRDRPLRQPGGRPLRGRPGDRGDRNPGDGPGVRRADPGVRSAAGARRPARGGRFGLNPGPD